MQIALEIIIRKPLSWFSDHVCDKTNNVLEFKNKLQYTIHIFIIFVFYLKLNSFNIWSNQS